MKFAKGKVVTTFVEQLVPPLSYTNDNFTLISATFYIVSLQGPRSFNVIRENMKIFFPLTYEREAAYVCITNYSRKQAWLMITDW